MSVLFTQSIREHDVLSFCRPKSTFLTSSSPWMLSYAPDRATDVDDMARTAASSCDGLMFATGFPERTMVEWRGYRPRCRVLRRSDCEERLVGAVVQRNCWCSSGVNKRELPRRRSCYAGQRNQVEQHPSVENERLAKEQVNGKCERTAIAIETGVEAKGGLLQT